MGVEKLSKAIVRGWIQDRHDNCLRIAATKDPTDRGGWLEDAEYFSRVIEELSPSTASLSLERFMREVGEWSDRQFPDQTVSGKLAHLAKEIRELRITPADGEEYADCFMLLVDAYRKAGGSADGLMRFGFEKLAINKTRDWEKPNPDGSVEHIRERTPT